MICTRSTLIGLWLGLTLTFHPMKIGICGLWLERISQVALCKLLQTEGARACRGIQTWLGTVLFGKEGVSCHLDGMNDRQGPLTSWT